MRTPIQIDELYLASDAFDTTDFEILDLEVVAALQRPTRITADVDVGELEIADDDLVALLESPATIRLRAGDDAYALGHRVESIELLTPRANGSFVYRVELVTSWGDLAYARRSAVFLGMTHPGILEHVLQSSIAEEDYELALARGLGRLVDSLEMPRLRHDNFSGYPRREYTVQFEETDLAFLQRLAEHEGIILADDHRAGEYRLVVGDHNGAFGTLAAPLAFSHHEDEFEVGRVGGLRRRLQRRSEEVVLRDYNWRTPRVPLRTSKRVEGARAVTDGWLEYYGEHFKTPEEGARYARLRAEEEAWPGDVVEGHGTCLELAPGRRFRVEGSPGGVFDRGYFCLATRWRIADGNVEPVRFEAIPDDVTYRPPRVTPKPRIDGLMHARVDGVQLGHAAPIDDHGRYKVRLPFDTTVGADVGRASRWIRMLQPHAGEGYGMHFPLDVGVEVMIAHLGGDPDRPVIVGSVPNPETPTPVSRANATQSRIRTRSGVLMVFEDDARAGGAR